VVGPIPRHVGELRAARAAVTAIFFLAGATIAAWSTRIPAIQERLGLSAGALGLAILGLEGGAVVGLPAGGALVARLGSPSALRIGFVGFPGGLVAVALAPSLGALMLALAVMAAATSVIDVAMNAQGIELERRYRRPVLSGMHAGHSAGLVGGGLAGTAAAAAAIPVPVHLGGAAAIGMAAGVAATHWLVREGPVDGQRLFIRPGGRLLLLGLVAFCAFLLDGAAYNWSAVHLRSEHGAAAGLAAAAFTAFALAMAVGRLAGDRLVARFGRVRVVEGCGAVAVMGGALAVAAPTATVALVAWAVLGLGLAAIAPTVLGAAPGVSAASAPVAIAAVTTVGYLGSFTGPPAIGALAQFTGLQAALGLLVVVGAATALLARLSLRAPSGG
jgi:MFS family permease